MTVLFTKNITRYTCSILINRPNKRNALNLETIRRLRECLDNFERDESLKIAVIGGVGGNFSAGYDLGEIIDHETAMPNIEQIRKMLWPLGTRLIGSNKITIAAIEGHAVGFGLELALKCDLRVADRDSRLGFFNRRFGIPIMNGGTVILPQTVGKSRALDLIATGGIIFGVDAVKLGLTNYVADVGCSHGRATNLARCISKFDQQAVVNDLKLTKSTESPENNKLLQFEREEALSYLRTCGPLTIASKFLKGELCRHGSFDLGSAFTNEPELTL